MLQHTKIKNQENNSGGTSWQSIGEDSAHPPHGARVPCCVVQPPKETEFCDSLPLQKETMDFFWPHHLAQGILVVSLPGIEPAPLAVKAQCYPWTNREVKTVFEYSKWVTHH